MANSDKLTIQEIRQTGHCVRGIRTWLVSHGFDFKDVVKNGVSIEALLATDDEVARQVVKAALSKRKEAD